MNRLVALIVPAILGCAGCSQDSAAQSAEAVVAADQPVAHGSHDPVYGGVVYMHGDLHFEVVFDRDGRHRVYFSDEVREELPASVVSGVELAIRREGSAGAETLAARVDESGESWIADGAAIDGPATARVSFTTPAGPYWIDVPVLGPTAP